MNPAMLELVTFGLMALIAVAGAVAVVWSRSAIRSALGLFAHVVALAGLYMTLSAHFLMAVQLIVYAGAVVVLFVFVIMMLGAEPSAPDDGAGRAPRTVGALSIVVVGALMAVTLLKFNPERINRPMALGTLREIGGYLFGPAKLPFEFTSILLTCAMVGAFAVARGHHDKVKLSTGLTDEIDETNKKGGV